MAKLTPLRAIRSKCLDCCCDQSNEVRLCPSRTCPLWPYRSGKGPKSKVPLTTVRSIHAKCLDCSGFIPKDVRDCWDTDCSLYPFRMGKNPNRAGMGGKGKPEVLREWRENQKT